MHCKPVTSEVGIDTERTIDKHEQEKEDRQHDHVQQLWDESPEKSGKRQHFCHYFGVTKLQNIFFSPK